MNNNYIQNGRKNAGNQRRRDKQVRIDPDFAKLLQDIPYARIRNGVEFRPIKELSSREITRLMKNTPSFPNVLKEVQTIPRKEDLPKIRPPNQKDIKKIVGEILGI